MTYNFSDEQKRLSQIIKDKKSTQDKKKTLQDNDGAPMIIKDSNEPKKEQKPDTTEVKDTVDNSQKAVLDKLEIITQALVDNQQKIKDLEEKHKKELEAKEQEASKKEKALQDNIEQYTEILDKFKGFAKMTGNPNPVTEEKNENPESIQDKNVNFNTQFPPSNRDKRPGLVRDFEAEQKKTLLGYKGTQPVYDTRRGDAVIWDALKNKALYSETEKWLKDEGLLQGRSVLRDEPTTSASLIGGFLPFLSSMMRAENREGFIFYQFTDNAYQFDKNVGDVMFVPRALYQPQPRTSADRLLSGSGQPFVSLDTNTQEINTSVVEVNLLEYGLGLPGLPGNNGKPISIPTFVNATSLYQLRSILNTNLWYDYTSTEELAIRENLELMSQTDADGDNIYIDGTNVVQDVNDLTAGSGGRLTDRYLINLHAFLKSNRIMPMPDDCYMLVLNSKTLADLKQSVREKYVRLYDANEFEALFNMMTISMNSENFRISGYVGKIERFHVFEGNSWGVETLAQLADRGITTLPDQQAYGVQEKLVGGNPFVFRTNYVFGRSVIARPQSKPFTVVLNNDDTFGREDKFVWNSYEGYKPLDISPTIDAAPPGQQPTPSQQRRAYRLLATEVDV